jgi:hypothetical protein
MIIKLPALVLHSTIMYPHKMKQFTISFLFITFLALLLLTGCSVLGLRGSYEQLHYTVIDRIENAEIRRYPARIVAEVNGMKNDNEAFRLLFLYISGGNSVNKDVAMTVPVQVDKASIKLAMTAPVETSSSQDNGVTMRFFLPQSYTAETAPKPNDPRIKIVVLPEEVLAVYTYSGIGSDERFRSENERLMNILVGSKWKVVSAPSFLGYDPPFTIPFLRRNEVAVKVE